MIDNRVCKKCGAHGQVVGKVIQRNVSIAMSCDCGNHWRAESGICPVCSKPNGYPSDGMCSKCYQLR